MNCQTFPQNPHTQGKANQPTTVDVIVIMTMRRTNVMLMLTTTLCLGNVKDLETETTSEECVGSVSTTTQGQSKLDTIRLRFGGTVTKPISVDASPEEVSANTLQVWSLEATPRPN